MGDVDDVLTGDQLLRAIFDSSAVGIAVVGPDGRPRRANPAMVRILGYTEPELRAMTFAEFTHPDDVATDLARFDELVAGQLDGYQIEKRFVCKDGTAIWARLNVSIHRGEQTLIVGMVEDITATRASEEMQRSLVHALGERVKELSALHRAADLLLETHGTSAVLLHEVAALLPPAMQYPEITTACVRYGDEIYATAGHGPTPWMLTIPFRTVTGGRGSIEVAYHEARADTGTGPFLGEEDALLASLADMVRVALDRRDTEEVMHAANERLNLALTTAGMGVWEWNVTTNVVRWSKHMAKWLGYDDEIVGTYQQFRYLVHPDDQDYLFGRLDRSVEGLDDLQGIEFRYQRHDAGWRSVMGSAVIMRDDTGRATRILAAVIDVTERRALEAGLRQAQKVEALGQVAGGVAHDFNNLLTVLLAGTETLRGEMAPDHPWREIVDDMHTASESGAALTRQLLAFSRKATFEPAAVDIGKLVARLEPLLTRITRTRIKVRLEVDPSAGMVWADPAQLEQVVMNLVVNARDAMPGGGVVTVATAVADGDAAARAGAPPGRYAVISVRDTGSGIDPELQTRIFEPFFTTKEAGKGTGLGLAVVCGVARQWQGHVTVDSAPGAGATFHVLFPQLA